MIKDTVDLLKIVMGSVSDIKKFIKDKKVRERKINYAKAMDLLYKAKTNEEKKSAAKAISNLFD